MDFHVNLNQLNVFYTVTRFHSFKAAANHLEISAPAVSIQIKNLEEALGFKVFSRKSGKLKLTKKAQQLLPDIEKIFHHTQRLNDKIQSIKKDEKKALVIAMDSYVAGVLGPMMYKCINRKMPSLPVVFVNENSQIALEKLKNKEVNIVVQAGGFPYEDIEEQEFISFDLPLVVAPTHPIVDEQPVSLLTLSTIPLIIPPLGSGTSRHIYRFFKEFNIPMPPPSLVLPSSIIVKALPQTTCGAFLNSFLIEEELAEGKLVRLETEKQPKSQSFFLGYLKESCKDQIFVEVLNILKDVDEVLRHKKKIASQKSL